MDKNNITEDNKDISNNSTDVDGVNADHEALLLEMAKAGVMYGHKKTRHDPHFAPYVFAVKNGIEVIDLEQTLDKINEVADALSEYAKNGKTIMVVGTQPASHDAVKKLAEKLNSPYVVNKWIGGLITNFGIISKRITLFKERRKMEEEGRYNNYTKKERLMIQREIDKMAEKFEGLENYTSVPDVMFIIDSSMKNHITALNEADRKGIIKIGIIDNDDNPEEFDYFVPANDHSSASINWVVNKIIDNIK